MRAGKYGWVALVAVLVAKSAFAAEMPVQSSMDISNRMGHRLGFYLGVGDPAPAIAGLNAAYNVTDFLRASVGYGKVSTISGISISQDGVQATESSATTIGVATRAFMPGWNLSPSLGLGWAHVSVSGAQTGFAAVDGFSESGSHVYGTIGADYQAKGGFNAAAGLRQSFRSGVGTAFYASAGWFVDWL